MPAQHRPFPSHGFGSSGQPLLERLRARVTTVGHALQRRDSDPGRKTTAAAATGEAPGSPKTPAVSHEIKALHIVYHTMGRTHRRYREKTGEQVPAELKAAARAFKREPSIFSLVSVAGYLDDLRLLKW